MIARGRRYITQEAAPDRLTLRETDVMHQLLQRKSNKQIAKDLQLSVYTVQYHLKNIYAKWGVRRRKEAASYFQS